MPEMDGSRGERQHMWQPLAGSDQEVDSAVSRAASFSVVLADWAVRPECGSRNSSCLDALCNKDTHDGSRPALAHHQVLLPRSAIIRMPFDQHQPVRIRVEPRRCRVQQNKISPEDIMLAGGKVDIPERLIRHECQRWNARSL